MTEPVTYETAYKSLENPRAMVVRVLKEELERKLLLCTSEQQEFAQKHKLDTVNSRKHLRDQVAEYCTRIDLVHRTLAKNIAGRT